MVEKAESGWMLRVVCDWSVTGVEAMIRSSYLVYCGPMPGLRERIFLAKLLEMLNSADCPFEK